jgi:hypothetical protein
VKVIFKRHYFLIKTKNENGVTILSGLLHPMIVNYSQKWLNYLLIKCIYLIGFKKKCTFKSLIAWAHITVRYHPFVNCFISWYLVQIINFLLIELPTILFAVWRETKQTRIYQGDYLVQKPTTPCPYLLERYCALFMHLQVDCVYMSVCSSC